MILLVDDDEAVRKFVRLILERAGYGVTEAANAAEALRYVETHAPPPELLLTDIVMPGMNGIALAARAHKLQPALHVLFMSGFAQDFARELSGCVCVSKPFKEAELLSAVQAAIGRPSAEGSASPEAGKTH